MGVTVAMSERDRAELRDRIARAVITKRDERLEQTLHRVAAKYAKVPLACPCCGNVRLVSPSLERKVRWRERTGRCRRCYITAAKKKAAR